MVVRSVRWSIRSATGAPFRALRVRHQHDQDARAVAEAGVRTDLLQTFDSASARCCSPARQQPAGDAATHLVLLKRSASGVNLWLAHRVAE